MARRPVPKVVRRLYTIVVAMSLLGALLFLLVPLPTFELIFPRQCLQVGERTVIRMAIYQTFRESGVWPKSKSDIVNFIPRQLGVQEWEITYIGEIEGVDGKPKVRYDIACSRGASHRLLEINPDASMLRRNYGGSDR